MSIRFYSAVAAVAIVIFTAVSAGAFEEEGVFFLYKNESQIGTIDYSYTGILDGGNPGGRGRMDRRGVLQPERYR